MLITKYMYMQVYINCSAPCLMMLISKYMYISRISRVVSLVFDDADKKIHVYACIYHE